MLKRSYESETADDTLGGTPLLGTSMDNYDTTYISEDRDDFISDDYYEDYPASKDREDDSDDDELTEAEETDSERRNFDDDVDGIDQLVKEAEGMEKQVREKMVTMPPWALKVCVLVFTLLAVIALVGGILYVFSIVADYQPIIQWIIVTIAILGNCLGSGAVYFSGSFKSEIEAMTKGVKVLQRTSDQLNEYVQDMMRNRGALARTKQTLDCEITKIEEDVQNFEENEKIIHNTGENIEKNAIALSRETNKLTRVGKTFTNEEKKFSRTVRTMISHHKNLETYNQNAKARIEKLTNVVESLEETIPELEEQLKRFNNLRKTVEMVSTQMGGDVDKTKTTINVIFNEIKELHIRQERIMFYQLLERALSTSQNRDEMDIVAFHRFTAQIPEAYNDLEELDDRWFGRVANNGSVGREDLKLMIDKITLSKIVDQE